MHVMLIMPDFLLLLKFSLASEETYVKQMTNRLHVKSPSQAGLTLMHNFIKKKTLAHNWRIFILETGSQLSEKHFADQRKNLECVDVRV